MCYDKKLLDNRSSFYVSFKDNIPALQYLESSLHRCVAHICSHMTAAWTGDIYLRQGTAIKDHHPGKPDKICNLRRAYLRTYMRSMRRGMKDKQPFELSLPYCFYTCALTC